MKKEMSIIFVLLLGVSFESYAGTGGARDGLILSLIIIGLLLIILGLINGVDFLKRNGKTMIYNAILFSKKMITLFRKHFNNEKSDHFDLHDFRLHYGKSFRE